MNVPQALSFLLLTAIVSSTQQTVFAESPTLQLGSVTFAFVDAKDAKQILAEQDEFVTQMSPFDRMVRMRTSDDRGVDSFRKFVAGETLDWNPEHRQHVIDSLEKLRGPLESRTFPKLPTIQLICTTGKEEGDAAYTRGSAIMIPIGKARRVGGVGPALIAHELFHVISRQHPKLKHELYRVLGFHQIGQLAFPDSLRDLKITNPDCPVIEHAIKIQLSNKKTVWVAPILYSQSEFNADSSLSLFRYLQFRLLELKETDDGAFKTVLADGEPVLHEPQEPDFQRQIGSNTGYIIHPEEVLADNFSFLITGRKDLPDPWILDALRKHFPEG